MDTSMIDTHMPVSSTPTAQLSRRSLLRGSVTLGLVALVGGLGPWQSVMAEGDQDFIALSQFLVSRPVNPVLAARYYRALSRRAPNFSGNVGALRQLVDGQGFKHVDEYLAQANPDPSLKATAISIISAWYLGIVGELADAELISYSEALMYRPTHGILIIPTYGGGPASWGAKPADTQDFKL
ncbi:Membrane bound FAD containing D-sorbitol dehydrogenase [Pseudomonas sp. NFACC15-1]|uniref:sugar dehydrogenase complex small subunit n=1 Tax=unclassified Pseudomonas TaxID=196821 RepID=UPI00088E2BA0|nr:MULTISPECIES: sugar dehydrogenase complex small subunit [unclassified Pseudomonas]SDA92777.1 Membrane bound FAD containing D-sorbitol dehydrogenase [Pseudomonas sp. NFACC15-1]SDB38353.1 Membrane bound FAD containing D-sorbitol dehydrogenase [Pseudomonas sp. NFACC13-1]SDZ09277.1 Membrane bound FAD containing D-sorbitol dehydrogenase [Pseudomonas sp. NFACC14]